MWNCTCRIDFADWHVAYVEAHINASEYLVVRRCNIYVCTYGLWDASLALCLIRLIALNLTYAGDRYCGVCLSRIGASLLFIMNLLRWILLFLNYRENF